MPANASLATQVWNRYVWCRENGHSDFVAKADLCERFFAGDQWDPADVARLKKQLRPALTINKIISTIANVLGEQIFNRSEIGFLPRGGGAKSETADTLVKVFKQISDNNQLDWRRSDMFADGMITSRGYIDVRMDYTDAMQGEVRITNLNPKNVIPDPDAEEYDPDTWNEVHTTKWLTADDIEILYSKDDAELLRAQGQEIDHSTDSVEMLRDRFSNNVSPFVSDIDQTNVLRNIRVVEKQHRKISRQDHFIDVQTGDMRPVPDGWDRNRIALVREQNGWEVISRLARRIRWTVVAGNVELHDDWSPYNHFTVIPYFPYFRRGRTIGAVENLIGSQELLNKVTSQELHTVNSSANGGYKIRAGALANMTVEQLEAEGAKTGIVIEVNGDPDKDVQKIQPNAMPTGLDRISYKAEEHIKTISGVPDSVMGQDRADVAAKAITQKRQAASTNNIKPLDSLNRTDFFLARNILSLVQTFYTEQRLMTISRPQGIEEPETFTINEVTPEGEIVNDMTLGEFSVIVSSVPQRESLEDSQFDQAVAMKQELGMDIPDEFIIEASRLPKKKDLLRAMAEKAQSPEAQAQAQLAQAMQEAELQKTQAEATRGNADAQLKQTKAEKEAATPIEQGDGGEAAMTKIELDYQLGLKKLEDQKALELMKLQAEREKMDMEMKIKAQAEADKAVAARIAAAQPRPQPQGAAA